MLLTDCGMKLCRAYRVIPASVCCQCHWGPGPSKCHRVTPESLGYYIPKQRYLWVHVGFAKPATKDLSSVGVSLRSLICHLHTKISECR